MSLNINGERLLAEALEDAMEQDLAEVPAREELEKQHRFSGKFVRRMKRLEKEHKKGNNAKSKAESGEGAGRTRDFAALGKRARYYGGMAAVLVCVVGLAAFFGVMGRMGASKGDMAPADEAAGEKAEGPESNGSAAFDETDVSADDAPADEPADEPADMPADDAADEPADDVADEPADVEENAGFEGEPAAPGWQEQLLAESEKADALISWHLAAVYDGTSFVLESELTDNGETDASPALTVSVSLIYEVYYRESVDEWVRVYRTDRRMERCEPHTVWGDEYFMRELNMTRPGTYRVVRQVNGYRQVAELTLEQIE